MGMVQPDASVVVFETQPWERAPLEAGLSSLRLTLRDEPCTAETAAAAADAEVVSCFIRSIVDVRALATMPAVRLVATRSTGTDHVDLAACAARGVAVANVPGYGDVTVAEHTFALLLALSRRIHAAALRTAAGDFSTDGLTGFDLEGRTLGVVGAGAIGRHVARIARGFGMIVLAHDVVEDAETARTLGMRYVPLDALVAEADVVSLHVPALPATRHLFDRARLALMRRGAILLNTARGSLVDTEALLGALESGHLAGAGLDVLDGEQYLADELQILGAPDLQARLRALVYAHRLLRRPDVVFTPHVAFNSREALARIVSRTVDTIRRFVSGAPVETIRPQSAGSPRR
jgi:D-lactate dehydrogenase